ncbi:MAG: hypothetical protein HFP81_09800 [Methylococcales symbiont of Hymedesmia sp. n. MRB-2018]|nr:MAG: hypothetical protein HFP78_04550 [Methylococcales symbiont of Hymedesmia sp. n. MRB-2018]KAF3983002.1 MAG: hypothetical protein HFP81_09800 [Methylococcales symbiont of Hymedesmia sp. n. MRB-2018]
MKSEQETLTRHSFWPVLLAIFSAIAASACCLGPLLLLSLGISGAWMSTLTSMTFMRPFFIILTVFFMVLAFHRLYFKKNPCQKQQACVSTSMRHRQRSLFWIVSLLILLLLTFPIYASFFI